MSEEEKIEKQSTDNASLSTENDNNVSERSTINEQPSTNMEVHKHPHHVTHKKKWGEYLLEFFMLFLAVFLGFIAENIREDSVEKHREKQFMQSMVEDLQKDIGTLERSSKYAEKQQAGLDSLNNISSVPFKLKDFQLII